MIEPERSAAAARRRVMILGIDGGTLAAIRPWAEAGYLPNLARLMREGASGNLTSVIPPDSPAAWSSFLTGANPGQHGIYDFAIRRPRSYETWLCSASRRSGTPLWGLLSRAGRRVAVFNVPVTYPVQPVNGLFISGLLTPSDATDGTWPPELQAEMQRAVPSFNFLPPPLLTPGEEQQFVDGIARLNQSNLEVSLNLLRREPWDFFMAVFTGADVVSHFLWRETEEAGELALPPAMGEGLGPSPTRTLLATALRECYRQIDAAFGELIAAAGPDVHVVVMSDHGFGRLDGYFDVNPWLLKHGYLKLKRTPGTLFRRALFQAGITRVNLVAIVRRLGVAKRARQERRMQVFKEQGLLTGPVGEGKRRRGASVGKLVQKMLLSFADVDWSRSRLFALGYTGSLYVNLKGRDPQGAVEPGAEVEALLEKVAAELKALRDPHTGQPLVGALYRPGELYHGKHVDEAPDLTLMPYDLRRWPVGMMNFSSRGWLTPSPMRSGMHRMEGILFLQGPGIRQGLHLEAASILDVAPTVLALMGEPIPTTMDGQVLAQAMSDELRASLTISFSEAEEEAAAEGGAPEMDAEEEERMRRHLRGLGYVA